MDEVLESVIPYSLSTYIITSVFCMFNKCLLISSTTSTMFMNKWGKQNINLIGKIMGVYLNFSSAEHCG